MSRNREPACRSTVGDDDVVELLGRRRRGPSVRSPTSHLPCSSVPPGVSTFSFWMASRTWSIESPRAFSFSMSTTMWISRGRSPLMLTSPTPSTDSSARLTCLSAISVSVRRLVAFAGEHDAHDRVGVGILLLDDRRQHFRRNAAHRAGHFLAHAVGGVVQVALEQEADRDRAPCRPR